MTWTYERTKNGYAKMWDAISIKPGADRTNANSFARKIVAAKARYQKVEALTGWPWFFIGALHMRESGCNFAGVLHNGEKIIGKGRKTKLVPAGRGPFKTWEDSAVDTRHTWATWHYQANRDLGALQKLGGWSTIEMVMRYAHTNVDELSDTIGRL